MSITFSFPEYAKSECIATLTRMMELTALKFPASTQRHVELNLKHETE